MILGKKIQNHTPFDTALEMEPYMVPGHASSQKMNLIGVISHQGTKEHGHYVAITNKGNEWTSYNDVITTQTTLPHLHQSQAYVLMYRKMEHSAKNEAPPSIMANQQSPTEKLKLSHKTHQSEKEPLLLPDPPIKIPLEENLPCQGRPVVGANPNPTHKERPTTENLQALETLLSNCCVPRVLETRGEGEAGGATELDEVKCPTHREGRPQGKITSRGQGNGPI